MAPNMESSPALEPVPVTGAGAGLRDDGKAGEILGKCLGVGVNG
jgi:hypothetical protein